MNRAPTREIGVGLVVATLLLSTASDAVAQDGTFQLVQCDPLHAGIEEGLRSGTAAYVIQLRCGNSGPDRGIRISTAGAAAVGRAARIRWSAPADMSIVGVRVEAKLRREKGHRARLYMADESLKETKRIATGTASSASWQSYSWHASGAGQRQFVAELVCARTDGCPKSDRAKTWLRNIRLTVVDHVRPTLQVSGDIFVEGWKRGQGTIWLEGADIGAGLTQTSVFANGHPIHLLEFFCGSVLRSRMAYEWSPCRSTANENIGIFTDQSPLADGANNLRVCVRDFADNQRCAARNIKIDNTPPFLSFPTTLNFRDPELIEVAATDAHSGLATGAVSFRPVDSTEWIPLPTTVRTSRLATRVNSTDVEAGDYEFLARAADVAGNVSTTTLRADGAPMVLTFPLREGVQFEARLGPSGSRQQTVPYGKASRVVGRLLDSKGRPLSDREVIVDEYFGAGALIDHRVRKVRTDANGRWSSRLPAGPSRSVTATFTGDAEHLPATVTGGRLSVKTGTRFRVSSRKVREGRAVRFHGKVGRVGARMPARGKLVQLQYFDPLKRRWFTVRNPFYTDSRGRYRTRYRFGRHYARNVRIRFRVRALPETGWPYMAASSRPRSVKVLAQ